MLDDFREWLSDNLRYILLGLAVILLIVIAFFAVRLVTGIGSPKESTNDNQTVTEAVTEAGTESQTQSTLVRNQEDVLGLMTSYYAACVNKDYDTLEGICEVFDETTQADIESKNAMVESYSNIITYSKPGLTDGSYVVFVYFDAKLTGVDTLAPGLRGFYLTTDSEGNLIISDMDSHPEQASYFEERNADDDVQELSADVNKMLADAEAADEDLKNLLNPDNTDNTGDADANGGDNGETPVVGTTTGTMVAATDVNVRSEASTDGILYGTIYTGTSVEVLENLDNGWSRVRYTSNGTTIEGYAMSQYLTEAQ